MLIDRMSPKLMGAMRASIAERSEPRKTGASELVYFDRTDVVLASILLAAAASAPRAAAAPVLSASDFNVYSLGGIRYELSDFEGRAGAAGDVRFSNFSLGAKEPRGAATLIVGGSAVLVDGSVLNGGVRAGSRARIERVDVDGAVVSGAAEAASLPAVSRELLEDSARLAALPEDAAPVWAGGLRLSARPGFSRTTLHLTAEDLAQVRVVVLDAARGQTLVVDVSGASASIDNAALTLTGEGGVVFNFPDARALTIVGAAVPGVVIAPRAATSFTSGRIDGRLYVGDLSGNGQVNETGSTALSDALAGPSCGEGTALVPPALPRHDAGAKVASLLGRPDFDASGK
jgi:choice-of-anchor A domain-containing protein